MNVVSYFRRERYLHRFRSSLASENVGFPQESFPHFYKQKKSNKISRKFRKIPFSNKFSYSKFSEKTVLTKSETLCGNKISENKKNDWKFIWF